MANSHENLGPELDYNQESGEFETKVETGAETKPEAKEFDWDKSVTEELARIDKATAETKTSIDQTESGLLKTREQVGSNKGLTEAPGLDMSKATLAELVAHREALLEAEEEAAMAEQAKRLKEGKVSAADASFVDSMLAKYDAQKQEAKSTWAELETDPRFQAELATELQGEILRKKFGADFYNEYQKLAVRAHFPQDDEGQLIKPKSLNEAEDMITEAVGRKEESPPLLPEVGYYEKKVMAMTSVEDLMSFAKADGLELTPQELENARQMALEAIQPEEEEDEE